MKTDLPDGTWICYRYKGEREYARITLNGTAIEVGLPTPPPGTVVHKCVWKKDSQLVVKSSFTM